jgi:hypothetical protein
MRPIQLLEITRKIWFGILWRRTMHTIGAQKFLQDTQYGSQKGKEASQAIQQLLACVEHSREQQRPLHVIAVDMRRAFDYAPRWGLQLAMQRAGVPTEIIRRFIDIEQHNTTYIRSGHWSKNRVAELQVVESFVTERGTPQGGVEAAGLYTLFIDILLAVLHQEGKRYAYEFVDAQGVIRRYTHLAYADDILLMSKSRDGARNLLEWVEAFCAIFGLEINHNKTKHLTF